MFATRKIALAAVLVAGMTSAATAQNAGHNTADRAVVDAGSVTDTPLLTFVSARKSHAAQVRRWHSHDAGLYTRRSNPYEPEYIPQRGGDLLGDHSNYDYYKDWHEACCF